MFSVYIIFSNVLNRFYCGFTAGDVRVRLNKHLSKHKGYTARAKDWVLVFCEKCYNKEDALIREKEIKSWKSKTRIQELIKTQNIPESF
ncbi:MAG: GIY-YIG nuclease family protein [Bacteroidia bacterium]|nr:GIY-YIG nuclease family protein [Bacteroidia bacterium]